MKRIWVDESILSQNTLRSIQKKMDEFQVPADLGRIPGKIYFGEVLPILRLTSRRIFF